MISNERNIDHYSNKAMRVYIEPNDISYKKLICKQCGRDFWDKVYVARSRNTHFCSRSCKHLSQKKLTGEKSNQWKGGKHITAYGYVMVMAHGHPNADAQGYIREHRLIMSQHIGRALTNNEDVHHINHIRDDNRLENLLLLSKVEHGRIHHRTGEIKSTETIKKMRDAKRAQGRFTAEDIRKIRELWANGVKQIEIAEIFHAAQGYINEIVKGKVWKEI